MAEADLPLEPWRHVVIAPIAPSSPHPLPAPDITQAISDRTETLVIERLLRNKGLAIVTTPKLNSLHDAFAAFTTRVEAAAEGLTKRMENVATVTENAVTKFGAAVDKVAEQAKSIDDAANQLTNGGPPLGNS